MRVKAVLSLVYIFLSATIATSATIVTPPPVNGTYISTDLGGGVMTGKISESWAGGSPGYGQVGNTVLISSVDGPLMGTQWEVWCSVVSTPAMLLAEAIDSTGTGETTWRTEYNGGFFWMSADGPWAPPGAVDYTGELEGLVSTMTYEYSGGQLVEVRSVVEISGAFDSPTWEGSCVEYTITGVTFVGTTDQGPKPGDYPAFMGADCGPWLPGVGAWGDVGGITVNVENCTETPVRNATWGEIRTLYGH